MLKIGLSQIKAIEANVQSDDEYISLSQGALKVGGVPQEIKDHLREVLRTDITDYYQSAWGIMPLREKIADYLSKAHSCKLFARNILVGHGCMGAISTLLLTLLEKGDEVLLPEPTYPAYKNIVSVARAESVFVPCMDEKNNWHLDLDVLEYARTEKTRVLLFSNPCNPCGSLVSQETLVSLVSWCEKHGIYLIVDESYDDYIFNEKFISTGVSASAFVPNSEFVIRTGSYSKSLSMSGWRVGYMVVPESLAYYMGTTQDALLNCPNVIAQHAVLYALDHPEHWKGFGLMVKEGRDTAMRLLQPLVDQRIISYREPDAGFYLFLKTREGDAFDLCRAILDRVKVGLIPGRAFGPSGAPFLRLCYARKQEVVREGVQRLIRFFEQAQAQGEMVRRFDAKIKFF